MVVENTVDGIFTAEEGFGDVEDQHPVGVSVDDQSAVEWWDNVGSTFQGDAPFKGLGEAFAPSPRVVRVDNIGGSGYSSS